MDEYISREAMLKNLTADLEHHSSECDPRTVLVMRRFIKYVEDFPVADVQPIDKWISVKDRLPEDTEPCAVVTENNGLGVSRLMGRNELEWTLFGEPVLYWMPLPELPKDGEHND